jgi:hypothetical protein
MVISTPEVSADAQALLGALKLTNAQRLAEIDKLEREIAEEETRIADQRVEKRAPDRGDDHGGGGVHSHGDDHDDDDEDEA